jgi:hypothetical protein
MGYPGLPAVVRADGLRRLSRMTRRIAFVGGLATVAFTVLFARPGTGAPAQPPVLGVVPPTELAPSSLPSTSPTRHGSVPTRTLRPPTTAPAPTPKPSVRHTHTPSPTTTSPSGG